MDPSQYRAVAPSSPAPRQSKVILQRQYREKEGECFNTLRDIINELTGEELQTRQEILRKAIDLLWTASEMKKLIDTQVVHPTQYGTHTFGAEDATSGHSGHMNESSLWSQTMTEYDTQIHYPSQPHHHGQLVLNADTIFHPPSSRGYGVDWSNYS